MKLNLVEWNFSYTFVLNIKTNTKWIQSHYEN